MFDCFPQSFISNVSKISNSNYLNLTYKELLLINFGQTIYKDDCLINKIAHKKFLKNKEILNYLEQNPEISQLSGFSAIKDLKYKELLEKYFNSMQFEKSILKLKNEKESAEYIIKYIFDMRKNMYIIIQWINLKKMKKVLLILKLIKKKKNNLIIL